jgi:uncharacterized protein (TIGR04255 family)
MPRGHRLIMSDEVTFKAPPVGELALGVQFRPIPAFHGLGLAPLRQQWRESYPTVQEHPALPPAWETEQDSTQQGVRFSLNQSWGMRYWFLNATGSELVQLQQDRLILNWRRTEGDPLYPRYRTLRERFEARARDVGAFAEAEGLGSLGIDQVEVNYINTIPSTDVPPGRLDLLLRHSARVPGHHLGDPEQARLSMVFRVPELGRGPVRLYLGVEPGARAEPTGEVSFLTITVRGAPAADTLESALSFMDDAHAHAVKSFSELISEPIQTRWERQ